MDPSDEPACVYACNCAKDQRKRLAVRRYAGVFVTVLPCGCIVTAQRLLGAESLPQVAFSFSRALDALPHKTLVSAQNLLWNQIRLSWAPSVPAQTRITCTMCLPSLTLGCMASITFGNLFCWDDRMLRRFSSLIGCFGGRVGGGLPWRSFSTHHMAFADNEGEGQSSKKLRYTAPPPMHMGFSSGSVDGVVQRMSEPQNISRAAAFLSEGLIFLSWLSDQRSSNKGLVTQLTDCILWDKVTVKARPLF